MNAGDQPNGSRPPILRQSKDGGKRRGVIVRPDTALQSAQPIANDAGAHLAIGRVPWRFSGSGSLAMFAAIRRASPIDLGQCGSIQIGAHDSGTQRSIGERAVLAERCNGYGPDWSLFRGEVIEVDTQLANKSGFTNNFWVQMAALVIVTIIVIALAAKFIW